MKKRTLSVTVVGWVVSIWGILWLAFPFLNIRRWMHYVLEVYPLSVQLLVLLNFLILLGLIIAGVQILKRKEFGRRLIVTLSAVNIFHMIIGEIVYDKMKPINMRDFYLVILGLLMSFGLIYFFTRPKIKEQFE